MRVHGRGAAAVVAAGVAVTAAAVAAARTSVLEPAGHVTALHVTAGLTFILVGVAAWWRPASARVGALMCAVGFAWFVPDLGFVNSSLAVTLALLEGTIAYGLLAHLFVAFPTGRLRSTSDRAVVGVVYAWTLLGNLIPDSLVAPAEVPCGGCPHNLAVLRRDPGAHTLAVNVHQIGNMLLALVVLGVVIGHWRRATRPAHRTLAPVALAAGPVEAAIICLNVVGVVGSLDWLNSATPVLTPLAVSTLPFAFLAGILRSRMAGGSLGRLVLDLGAGRTGGRLRDALADALGDPALEIAYRRADSPTWVDAEGTEARLSDGVPDRAVTLVEQHGQPIAALSHDASLLAEPWLLDAVCAAASLAIENERLRADVAAQLVDVRASRARIVEAADSARRRIERDLHDGAQQRLVSVLLTLRSARSQASDAGAGLQAALEEAIDAQHGALAELRALASGIHPSALAEGGLRPALCTLAELSPVEVALESVIDERLPASVEAAAYFVVSEALTNVSKHAAAHRVTVDVARADGVLCVEVADDGVGGADIGAGTGLRGLADRVAALDGHIDILSPPNGGTRIVATIPCE